jgi:lipopolysaccharide transport system permease protein
MTERGASLQIPYRGDDEPGRLADPSGWIENRPESRWWPSLDVREMWRYRELAYILALRDLKLRYKQTVFGVAWALIRPLAAAAIFAVVLGRVIEVPADGLPYIVFVYAGLVVWTYFATSAEAAAQSLVENSELVSKVYIPRILAPIASVGAGVVDLSVSLVVLIGFMAVFGVVPGVAVALVPLWLAGAVVVALGAGLWLSALNVQYRDVRHAISFVFQVWLFASPVVYPSSLIDGWWEYVFAANPIVGVLDGFRWSALGAPPPGPEDLISLVVGTLLIASGTVYFRRAERRFADVI